MKDRREIVGGLRQPLFSGRPRDGSQESKEEHEGDRIQAEGASQYLWSCAWWAPGRRQRQEEKRAAAQYVGQTARRTAVVPSSPSRNRQLLESVIPFDGVTLSTALGIAGRRPTSSVRRESPMRRRCRPSSCSMVVVARDRLGIGRETAEEADRALARKQFDDTALAFRVAAFVGWSARGLQTMCDPEPPTRNGVDVPSRSITDLRMSVMNPRRPSVLPTSRPTEPAP